ncbi:MAG TPA: cytochrome c-type biogenesis protein CcmH [Myxococcota bacterium]|nr:cytochrome c-type biogenesis protein CcmH [Myxococcota bacterium]
MHALAFVVLCASLLGIASPAQAQQEEGWGYALANELMSPWCPGFALPDCSSGYASELRLWILEQERLGRSEEEVKAEILAKYGEQMLQAPSARGRGILAYAIPAVLILAGGVVLIVFLRKQGGTPARAPVRGDAPLDPMLLSRVEAEIEASKRDA